MAEKDVIVLDWPEVLGGLEQNGATPAGTAIKDSDGKEIDNGFLWKVSNGYLKDAIKAESVEDMVAKVLASLEAGDCIKSLALVGHGASGNVSVGDGSRWKPGKHIDGNRAEWEKPLTKLCDKFCKEAEEIEILLLGCDTGVCDGGAQKMFDLAKFFKDCAKGAKGKFCVYGTKRKSAEDVEDAIRNKRRDHLVSVCSDSAAVPACLAPVSKDGLKEKEKPPREIPRPQPSEFSSVAFRDSRTVAGARSPLAVLIPPPITVRGFLGLYDLTKAYEPAGLPRDIDGQAVLVRRDGSTEAANISFDFAGIEFARKGDLYLFLLRNLDDRATVRDLVATGRLKEC